MAKYTDLKLFKEHRSKSDKQLFIMLYPTAVWLGKGMNLTRNSPSGELEKRHSNHYIILVCDAGCQGRALYYYYPDTKGIYKLTCMGSKSITKRMTDKLYIQLRLNTV